MTDIRTASGFEISIDPAALDNWELLEALSASDENPYQIVKICPLLLGKDGTERLKNHLRTENGIVPASGMEREITEIFNLLAAKEKN